MAKNLACDFPWDVSDCEHGEAVKALYKILISAGYPKQRISLSTHPLGIFIYNKYSLSIKDDSEFGEYVKANFECYPHSSCKMPEKKRGPWVSSDRYGLAFLFLYNSREHAFYQRKVGGKRYLLKQTPSWKKVNKDLRKIALFYSIRNWRPLETWRSLLFSLIGAFASIIIVSVVSLTLTDYFLSTGNSYKTRVLEEKISTLLENQHILYDKHQSIELLTVRLEALISSISSDVARQNLLAKTQELQSISVGLSGRLADIENAISTSPIKSLATNSIRKDVNQLDEDMADLRAEVKAASSNLNSVYKWFLQLAASLIVGVAAAVGISIHNKRKSVVEHTSSE